MDTYFFPKENIGEFFKKLSAWGKLYRCDSTPDGGRIKMLSEKDFSTWEIHGIRSAEPAKFFFVKAKCKVSEYFDSKWRKIDIKNEPRVIVGLKACDLNAVKMWDNVFKDDENYKDPFYISSRENTLLIGTDCTSVGQNCFCTLLDGKPYPTDGTFDISLAPTADGFVVSIATEKGKKALDGFPLQQLPSSAKNEVEENRKKVTKAIEEQNKDFKVQRTYRELVEKGYNSDSFKIHGSSCVSCAACTYVCPMCFCFQLYDKPLENGKYERFLALDSCQYPRFSFMAGGLNPRGTLLDRFRHRYDHKFHHYHWRYNAYSCTGCGRCIENCMGKIDMRETLRDIEKMSK